MVLSLTSEIVWLCRFIRAQPLSANSLVHVQGVGDFMIDEIVSATEQKHGNAPHRNGSGMLMEVEEVLTATTTTNKKG